MSGTKTGRTTSDTPNFEDVDKERDETMTERYTYPASQMLTQMRNAQKTDARMMDEHFTADTRSIIQQCYDARRELPEALGAWMRPTFGDCPPEFFARRMQVAHRIASRFNLDQRARFRSAAMNAQ